MVKLEKTITEENARLDAIINSNKSEFILGAPQLHDEDCIKIARLIIIFNYIEINMRRMLEFFIKTNNVTSRHLKYGIYADASNLREKLLEGFSNINITVEEKDYIESILSDIDYCRNFRNIFAHFAARRFPNEPAIVFFSKDDKEAIKRTGNPIGYEHLTWMVLLDKDIDGLLKRISAHEIWISEITSKLYCDLILEPLND